jgi:hypothetical protein
MVKSKELNITTSEIILDVNNEIPTHQKSIRKIMEVKKICRNGVLGVDGEINNQLNLGDFL